MEDLEDHDGDHDSSIVPELTNKLHFVDNEYEIFNILRRAVNPQPAFNPSLVYEL